MIDTEKNLIIFLINAFFIFPIIVSFVELVFIGFYILFTNQPNYIYRSIGYSGVVFAFQAFYLPWDDLGSWKSLFVTTFFSELSKIYKVNVGEEVSFISHLSGVLVGYSLKIIVLLFTFIVSYFKR